MAGATPLTSQISRSVTSACPYKCDSSWDSVDHSIHLTCHKLSFEGGREERYDLHSASPIIYKYLGLVQKLSNYSSEQVCISTLYLFKVQNFRGTIRSL